MEINFSAHKLFQLQTILVLILVNKSSVGSHVPRPRGVSLSRAPLYSPETDFRCFDQTKTIPFTQVNDDYCDCADGSDEPGTPACPNGVFHCTNAGHRPLNVAASRVNDGICDCCDGSDEYKHADCANVCIELGRHAREEAQRHAELVKAGKQVKAELSQKGVQLKQEKKSKLDELQKNKDEAEKVRNEQKSLKEEVESRENAALDHYRKIEEEEKQKLAEIEVEKKRQESADYFKLLDSNQDGVVDISELQTRQSLDKDRDGEVSIEEAKFFLNNEESADFERFVSDAWPNIAPFLLMDKSAMFKPPASEAATEADDLAASENGEPHDDEEEEEEEAEEAEEEEEAAAPISPKYDEDTQKLIEEATTARDRFNEADSAFKAIETEIKAIQEYLEKDFGPEEEFASLAGECFEHSDREYTYRLCPFDRSTQTAKSGGGEVRLGAWGRWDGDDGDPYSAMLYEQGQSCWNGPQRSTRVKVTCGIENAVIGVSEPNRCEYLFEFTTPAACKDAEGDAADADLHDEL